MKIKAEDRGNFNWTERLKTREKKEKTKNEEENKNRGKTHRKRAEINDYTGGEGKYE